MADRRQLEELLPWYDLGVKLQKSSSRVFYSLLVLVRAILGDKADAQPEQTDARPYLAGRTYAEFIAAALAHYGTVRAAAEALKIPRSTLQGHLKRRGVIPGGQTFAVIALGAETQPDKTDGGRPSSGKEEP